MLWEVVLCNLMKSIILLILLICTNPYHKEKIYDSEDPITDVLVINNYCIF